MVRGRTPGTPLKDITGKRFGCLVAVARAENDAHGNAQWLCRCDCGATLTRPGIQLRSSKPAYCPECRHQRRPFTERAPDMTGTAYDAATVASRAPNRSDGSSAWTCVCRCGRIFEEQGSTIRNAIRTGAPFACPGCRPKWQRHRRSPAAAAARRGRDVCKLCGSLAHRVLGPKCRRCGLTFRELPEVHADSTARRFDRLPPW